MARQFGPSLERIACVSAAASIWEKELSKNETKKTLSTESIPRKVFYNLVKTLIKKTNETNLLPGLLAVELLLVIKYMGLRIFGWIRYLRNNSVFNPMTSEFFIENCIKNIFWTHYGTIDEMKIFKLNWSNNPNVDISAMYRTACRFCLEREVHYFCGKIAEKKIDFYRAKKSIIGYWNNVTNFHSGTVEENMLRLCAKLGNHIGFKYFWNKLNSWEKENNILKCLQIILEQLDKIKDVHYSTFKIDKYCEICNILFQGLIEKKKDNLRVNSSKWCLYLKLFSTWPWQEMLFLTFEDLRIINGNNGKCFFLQCHEALEKAFKREIAFHLPYEGSELRKIFRKLWQATPSAYKLEIASKIMNYYPFGWDLLTIELILNDKDLIKHKAKLHNLVDEKFFKLVKQDETNQIKKFLCRLSVQRILKNNDLEIWENIYGYLLEDHNLEAAKVVLSKSNHLDNSRKDMKKGLAIDYIWYYFIIKEKFDLADKFLFWMLRSSEKVNDFKKSCRFAKNLVLNVKNGSI